jgi:hypothetical protein
MLTSITPGRGDADDVDARVVRRRIAFDLNGQIFLLRRRLDRGDQFQVILDLLDRRHEQQSRPSRGSTAMAVRTEPPSSPEFARSGSVRRLRFRRSSRAAA